MHRWISLVVWARPFSPQDFVVHVLEAETQAGDPDVPDRADLGFGQGAGLALEGDFVELRPGEGVLHPDDEAEELLRTDERRGSAAEIDEVEGPPREVRLGRVELDLPRQSVEVALDLLAVLVGIDPEVAELAPLPAEGNVQVEPEVGRLRARRLAEDPVKGRHLVRLPAGIGRVVGDEDVAEVGLGGALGHFSGPGGCGKLAVRGRSRILPSPGSAPAEGHGNSVAWFQASPPPPSRSDGRGRRASGTAARAGRGSAGSRASPCRPRCRFGVPPRRAGRKRNPSPRPVPAQTGPGRSAPGRARTRDAGGAPR